MTAYDVEIPETSCESVKCLVSQYDWDTELALKVAQAESNLQPDAYNPEAHRGCNGSYGVFQISCVHDENPSKFFDEEYNIKRAYELYELEGWIPWGVCHDGKVDCGL